MYDSYCKESFKGDRAAIDQKRKKTVLIAKIYHNCLSYSLLLPLIVTGFEKIVHVRTRIEIHFIAYHNNHTCALSRHNNKTGIDK